MNNLVEATTGDRRNDGRLVLLVVDDDDVLGAELVDKLSAHRIRGHHFPHPGDAAPPGRAPLGVRHLLVPRPRSVGVCVCV